MTDDQLMGFIKRNQALINQWVEREEKRVEHVKLPFTEADYERMGENIRQEIDERELLKRLFGYENCQKHSSIKAWGHAEDASNC